MSSPDQKEKGVEKTLAEILEEERLRDLWIERVFMKRDKRRRKCKICIKKKKKH